jgi:hypothetical protein
MVERDDIREAVDGAESSQDEMYNKLANLADALEDFDKERDGSTPDMDWVEDWVRNNAQDYDAVAEFADDLKTKIHEEVDSNPEMYVHVVERNTPDSSSYTKRGFLGALAGGLAAGGILTGFGAYAATQDPSGDQVKEEAAPSRQPEPVPSEVVYGGSSDLSLEEGDALLEYLLRRTDTQGMPVDIEDLENYTDGDGIEMTGIHASLEEGQPSDDSIVEVQLDDGRSKTSNEAEDYAAEVLTEFADYDGTVDQYISDIEG